MSRSLLGITFQEESFKSILQQGKETWASGGRLRIATVNPEFLVAAEKSRTLKENLQKAELRVVDGVGLWLALRLRGWQGKRITGSSLVPELLSLAEKEGRSVLVILKKEGLSLRTDTKKLLLFRYPNLQVQVRYETRFGNADQDLIFIATGIPEQEFMAEQFQKGVVIGVGGAIDFLTGAQKRAPKIFQTLGVEWLWRLLLQPKRIKRIWNAVIVFPFLVVMKK